MSFPAYSEYKDSGVEWLGEIPNDWRLIRYKQIFSERRERSQDGSEELLSVSAYFGVKPRAENMEEGDHLTRAESLEGYKVCKKNDLVMNIMLAWNCGLGFAWQEGIVSPAYSVFSVIDDSNPQYLDYLVRSNESTRYFKAHSTGVIDSRLRLYPETFGRLHVALPPSTEQIQIARFLDHETARIDALIEEQQRLIELLKEKRQAVISHAVTKGLDPTVPMKNSGVEWLCEVPAHWEVKPLKRVVVFQRGHDLPSEAREEGDVPIISSGGYSGFHSVACAKAPGIVTGRYGSIGSFVLTNKDYWPLNTALYSINLYDNNAKYVWYLLQAYKEHFMLNSLKSAVPGVDRNDIHEVMVVLASAAEQNEIINYLDNYSSRLDNLTAEATKNVLLLQERRAALISAAVTGKIDVRNWQPPAPAAA